MEFHIRRIGEIHANVKVADGGTTIEIGLLDEDERLELAKTLVNAAYELGPKYCYECNEWFRDVLLACDIQYKSTEEA